jgi:hypothetical protein
MTTTGFIQLDTRKRAQLSRFLPEIAPINYRIDVRDDGVITLSPAHIVTDHELRLIQQRPDLVALIRSADKTGALPAGAGPRVKRSATTS